MAKANTDFKKQIHSKLLEFRKSGLEQYGKYLDQQLKLAGKKPIKKLYKEYIEKQIISKDKKIKKIDEKLKKL